MIQTIFGSPVVILKVENVEELFSTEVYEETINHLMRPDNKFIDHPYARGGKICTTDLNSKMSINRIVGLDILWKFLKATALEHVHLYSNGPVKDLKFRNSWINLTFQGCEIKNHNDKDPNTGRSMIVTFYPKVPFGGANLVFIHNSNYGEWASDRSEKDLVQFVIEEGNIVIFDNLILHAVAEHSVEIPRMCIATEFTIEK
jgi:hypothetical protein